VTVTVALLVLLFCCGGAAIYAFTEARRWREASSRAEAESEAQRAEMEALRAETETLRSRALFAEAHLQAMSKTQAQWEEQFRTLAADTLQSNSQLLLDRSREQMQRVVEPVSLTLRQFEEHVRKLESERAAALEVSDRLKAAVLSSLSHELKSPLATIRAGLTTLGMKEAGLDPDQRSMVEGLDVQARRLDHLVRDLLTMSRLEAGATGERVLEDVAEIVGTVLQALRSRLEPYRLEVQVPELPPVLGDELQLDQVLTNLLENAAEWTAPGGRIEIGARRHGELVETWVENEGPAIPPTELRTIFDTFWSGRAGGTGLGLAICRRIVEAHGGQMQVEPNPGGGTVFRFTLLAVSQEEFRDAG